MAGTPKRPRDPNQLAKFVVDAATGASDDASAAQESGDKSSASALGRLGGLKGGRARAKALSPSKRKEIARAAAAARWKGREK